MRTCITLMLLFLTMDFFYVEDARSQTVPCNISFKDGQGIRSTRLIGLHQDLLLVSDTGSYKIININKIAGIKFDKGTYLWTGAAIGAIAGFLGGIVYYEIFGGSKKRSVILKDPTLGIAVLFSVPCSLIGGVIGTMFRNIDDYELSKMSTYNKAKEIRYIMKDYDSFK